MKIHREKLLQDAKDILYFNWKDGFTVPSERLYPFQWNWDSGFVSLGFINFNVDYAMQELRSLFSGQWKNGMVPHIIFHGGQDTGYFPNPSFWGTDKIENAPNPPKTSGITQPPVHGFVLEALYTRHQENKKVHDFVEELFPKIVSLHTFFYEHRNPLKDGLVYIYHPWESGRDNSPLWDDILKQIHIDKDKLRPYKRVDNTLADPSERPTTFDYDRYIYLLELGRKHEYAGPKIAEESPFLVQDVLINTVLIKSNESLINLGKEFGYDTHEIKDWNDLSTQSFNDKLWNEALGTYTSYDLRNDKQIALKEVAGLAPLFANIPDKKRANILLSHLTSITSKKEDYLLYPSFDIDHELFDPKKYWRGPVWPQMNWLLYKGLQNYGFSNWAERVKSDILELVFRLGFYEYFDPRRKVIEQLERGYGGSKFSWTAAVVIDLLSEHKT